VSAALSPPQTSVSDASRLDKLPRLSPRQVRIFFWLLAIALGAAQAWATRFTMNPDGISYLDIGDAYWRGDWHMAINAYWSPLYSWILGFFLKVLKPSAYWEYPIAHLVNFLIYVAAMGCFEFFLRNFIRSRRDSDELTRCEGNIPLPEWTWWALGYTLFISTSLQLITLRLLTPDVCVSAFVYLAAGIILKIRARSASWGRFALLGAVLGFGYLAKAVMFPLAFVFIAVAGCSSTSGFRQRAKYALVSVLALSVIAGPFVFTISHAKGHLTFGESGKLTYAAFVNGVDPWYPEDGGHLIGDGTGLVEDPDSWSPNREMLRHHARRVFSRPAAYEFAKHVEGTYPFWYDPSYWQEGIRTSFNLKSELDAIKQALMTYCHLSISVFLQLPLLTGLFTLYLLNQQPPVCVRRAAECWPMLVLGLAGVGLYAPVHTEYRYVGVFVLLLWVTALAGVQLPVSRRSQILLSSVLAAVVAINGMMMLLSGIEQRQQFRNADAVYWHAAEALQQQGIEPGNRIAMISEQPLGEGGPYVARLARVKIIAQVNRPDLFWTSDLPTRSQIVEALVGTGADAILAWRGTSELGLQAHWQQLADTPYYLYRPDNRAPIQRTSRQ